MVAMERVLGIRGIFFRAQTPKARKEWSAKPLGFGPASPENPYEPWEQQAGPTVFEPFPANTEYFGRESQQWMINFRVRDLDAMVAQLDRKSTRLNSSHIPLSRMPSSA